MSWSSGYIFLAGLLWLTVFVFIFWMEVRPQQTCKSVAATDMTTADFHVGCDPELKLKPENLPLIEAFRIYTNCNGDHGFYGNDSQIFQDVFYLHAHVLV